jgi:hypothetical protein
MNIILLSSTDCSMTEKWPLSRAFCGARWNRATDLSIISANVPLDGNAA